MKKKTMKTIEKHGTIEQLKSKNWKKRLIKKIEKEEKSRDIVLLKDNLNEILINFDMNFTNKGENIL